MSLQIKHITKHSEEVEAARKLYEESFPSHERMPFWFLLWRAKKGPAEFLAFYDEDEFVGFAYVVADNKLTLVLFLAVDGQRQSKGYGRSMLNATRERYPHNQIVLDVEPLDAMADNHEQRERRFAFYEKNGFKHTQHKIVAKDDSYDILSTDGQVSYEDYQALYRLFTGPFLYFWYKPQLAKKE